MSDKDKHREKDALYEGRDQNFMDIDRMINEGLGGGNVTRDGGLIEDTTTDTMDEPDTYKNEYDNEELENVNDYFDDDEEENNEDE